MKIISRIVLMAIASYMLLVLSCWFSRKSMHIAKVSDFYSSREEYDILAFGPSYMYVTLMTPELYRATGIRSFVPGTPCQPLDESFYYVTEALERFKPKVILLGADMIVFSPTKYTHTSAFAHEAVDGFPWGMAKFGMIANLETDSGYDEFVVPFIKYHSRWKELGKNDFVLHAPHNDFNGSTINVKAAYTNNVAGYDLGSCARGEIFEDNLRLLERLNKKAKDNGVELVLVASPRGGGFAEGRLAALHDYCAENGIAIIDLLLDFDKTGIANETDYYDNGHLNVFGAEKATRYIGKWLVDHYDFNTNMTAECRARWDAEVARYDKAKATAIAVAKKANKSAGTGPAKR